MEIRKNMNSERCPGFVFVAPFPPFVGGAAKNTERIAQALEQRGAFVTRLATNRTKIRSEHARSLLYYGERCFRFLVLSRTLVAIGLKRRASTCYIVPDGGIGIAFSAIYVGIARLFFDQVVIHHRNYSHIRNKSKFMRLLLTFAPKKTLHVFLDPDMLQSFRSAYNLKIRATYVPNAATCDISPMESAALVRDTKVIAFLSNLTEEKGFDVVEETMVALGKSLPESVSFRIAGRPVDEVNLRRLERLKNDLGPRLDYRGEVFGDAKAKFFEDVDVFLFPTRFAQEAQPNVLYEAMAAGCSIVTTRWAGIPWLIEDSVARMVELGPSTAEQVKKAVHEILESSDPQSLRLYQVRLFERKKNEADAKYSKLLDSMMCSGSYSTVSCGEGSATRTDA